MIQAVTNKLKGLYGITNQDMLLDNNVLMRDVELALKGGMSILQYRNKHQSRLQNLEQLIALKHLCHRYNALFIINDDINLCLKTGADGVHIGHDDCDITHARDRLGAQAIIGVSCYDNFNLALTSQQLGASYVAFGAFYQSMSKPEAQLVNINILNNISNLHIPVCCIGGINNLNALPLIEKGAHMLAVINELFNHSNIQTNAEKFSKLF